MNAPQQQQPELQQQPDVNTTPAPRESRTLTSPMNGMLFQPRSFGELLEFCKMVAASGMTPEVYVGNPGAVLVAIQMGAEIGLSPMQALQNITVINGRPSLWGDAGLAVVKGHRDFVDIIEDIREDGTTVTLKRRNATDVVRGFDISLAKEAGLWDKKGPWQNYPMRMMQMRARWWAMRDQFPDALRGIHSAEESQDIDRYGTNAKPTVQPVTSLDDVVKNAKPALVAATQQVVDASAIIGQQAPKVEHEHPASKIGRAPIAQAQQEAADAHAENEAREMKQHPERYPHLNGRAPTVQAADSLNNVVTQQKQQQQPERRDDEPPHPAETVRKKSGF